MATAFHAGAASDQGVGMGDEIHLQNLGAVISTKGFRLHQWGNYSCLIASGTRVRLRRDPLRSCAIDCLLAQLERDGERTFRELIGPFAIVLWRNDGSELLAARDPLGLLPLYHSVLNGQILISSNLDTFERNSFSRSFVAQFVVERGNPNTLETVRQGVNAVEPGTVVRRTNSGTRFRGSGRRTALRLLALSEMRLMNSTDSAKALSRGRSMKEAPLGHTSPVGWTHRPWSRWLDTSQRLSPAPDSAEQ